MQGVRPADEDRLPWLEPYRESKRPVASLPPSRGKGGPLAIAGLGLLLAVGAGGYLLGQREEAPAPSAPSSTITLPAPKPAPVEVAQAPQVAEPVAAEGPPTLVKKSTAAKKTVRHRAAPRKKIRTAGLEHARLDAIRAQQERKEQQQQRLQQERLALRRPWPKMPSPGPAGQVIQLGAFSSATRANAAYYQRIARYKGLAGLPKVVVPVVTRPDHRILYVLRLGTTSRQQSKTVCRNLRASGDHCLVIG